MNNIHISKNTVMDLKLTSRGPDEAQTIANGVREGGGSL